jgi:hypothetical protein
LPILSRQRTSISQPHVFSSPTLAEGSPMPMSDGTPIADESMLILRFQ